MRHAEPSHSLFVADIPLLFEANMSDLFDETIAVLCTPALAIKRAEKKGLSSKDYHLRMSFQLSPAQKAQRASHVIQNNQDLKALETNVKELIHQWNKM